MGISLGWLATTSRCALVLSHWLKVIHRIILLHSFSLNTYRLHSIEVSSYNVDYHVGCSWIRTELSYWTESISFAIEMLSRCLLDPETIFHSHREEHGQELIGKLWNPKITPNVYSNSIKIKLIFRIFPFEDVLYLVTLFSIPNMEE
jgi:hypothetical protein